MVEKEIDDYFNTKKHEKNGCAKASIAAYGQNH